MLPWKLRKRHILPVNQNLSSMYFSLAKFQLVSCNLSLAMIWQIIYTHKLPKLCSATLRAIMALNHSRLGLENKSGRIFFAFDKFIIYFAKSCQQVCGRVNQPFILFIHHIWGETVPWGAVFIIQTSDRMRYFTILQYKLHSFNIQDDRSTRYGLLTKPLKKFPRSPTQLAGSQ